jgi:hypothetical protein
MIIITRQVHHNFWTVGLLNNLESGPVVLVGFLNLPILLNFLHGFWHCFVFLWRIEFLVGTLFGCLDWRSGETVGFLLVIWAFGWFY